MNVNRSMLRVFLLLFLIVMIGMPFHLSVAQDDDYEDDYSDEYYEDEGYEDEYYDDEGYDDSGESGDEYYDDEGYDDSDESGVEYYEDEGYDDSDESGDEYYDDESFDGEYDEYYYDEYYEEYADDYGDFVDFEEFYEDFEFSEDFDPENVEAQFDVEDTELAGTPDDAEQQLWDAFTSIIPAEWVARVSSFEITNEPDTAGYVYTDENDPNKFVLALNPTELNDPAELRHTIIHEFAHILTLNGGQFNMSGGTCSALELDEGCTNDTSYVNQFHAKFWANGEGDASAFVTDYASSNVAEDIAESFTVFVLTDQPTGNTVADQKIRFFYQFPELLQLRQQIRANIANLQGGTNG